MSFSRSPSSRHRLVDARRVDEHDLGVGAVEHAAHRGAGGLRLVGDDHTFWPRCALSSVDFPTLGRPTSVTKPERNVSPSRRRPVSGAGRRHPRPGAMRRPSIRSTVKRVAVDVDVLALRGHVAERAEHEAADGVPVSSGRSRSSSSFRSSIDRPPSTRRSPSASALHLAVLHVVLVEDLADQLLDAGPRG